MNRILVLTLATFFCSQLYSQTDSTDITLSTNSAVLLTAMDSLLYADSTYQSYQIEFTISDTVNFGEVLIDLSSEGRTISKISKTLSQLQTDSLIDNNWLVDIELGNFENIFDYKVALVIKDYAGISNATIIKHY